MLTKQVRLKFDQSWMIFLVCLLGAVLVLGAVRLVNTNTAMQHIGLGVAYVEDPQAHLSIENIINTADLDWQTGQEKQLSFGMTNHPVWLKFELPASANQSEQLLEIDYALLDNIHIWFYSSGKFVAEHQLGDSKPFNERLLRHEKFLIPLPESPGELQTVLRVQTGGTLRVPIRLWEKDTFWLFSGEQNALMGLFFGFMTAMGLSNLFFFITTRSFTFLTYCGYAICVALTLATLHGLSYKYLWPNSIWLQTRGVGLFATGTVFFSLIFTNQLLNVRRYSPILYQLLKWSSSVFLVAIILSVILPYSIYIKMFLPLLSLAALLIYFVGSYLWYKGVRIARFYTLAWSVLLVSGFTSSLDNWNVIALDIPSRYLLMFGAAIETFLLALTLAISYSYQRQTLFDSQALALQEERLAREAQEDILKVKEEAQEELEYKVEERTLELEIALRELSETNRELEKKNTMDALTGIRNRAYFDKKYLAEVRRSRREQTELSIVMIDIDYFKTINDGHGHLVGDECIRFIADLLKKNLKRPSDDVCRYGGEEFSLILPSTGQEGALQVVEAMRAEIEATSVSTSSGPINMTVSAGISTAIVRTVDDESRILEDADKALYQAKEQGRNQVCVAEKNTETSQE